MTNSDLTLCNAGCRIIKATIRYKNQVEGAFRSWVITVALTAGVNSYILPDFFALTKVYGKGKRPRGKLSDTRRKVRKRIQDFEISGVGSGDPGLQLRTGVYPDAPEGRRGVFRRECFDFSEMMKKRLGMSVYGDPKYVEHVLRYYQKSGENMGSGHSGE